MPAPFVDFARDQDEAIARAAQWIDNDPLPEFPMSLLSSAEIHDYARITAMLHPFYPGNLKSASYEAHLGGKVIYWDDANQRVEFEIRKGDQLQLKPNSITYVQVEPYFRLPNYIAIRFNLRIAHVHRGLLLGTGPLVDPGFSGQLLIPLHNLTASDYNIDTSKALIWIEFTKTTHGFDPHTGPRGRRASQASEERHFRGFPAEKRDRSADYYLQQANGGNPIRSSIPDALAEGRRSAARAERSARRIERTLFVGGGLAVVAVMVAGVEVYLQTYQVTESAIGLVNAATARVEILEATQKAEASQIDALKAQLGEVRQSLQPKTHKGPA